MTRMCSARTGVRIVIRIGLLAASLSLFGCSSGDQQDVVNEPLTSVPDEMAAVEPTAPPEPTSPPVPTPTRIITTGTQRGRLGEVVHVGNLDLVIHSVESFNSRAYNQFNEANAVVHVTATNARGPVNETYNFSPLFFTLIDGNGVGVSYETCAGCPNAIRTVDLIPGGTITGNVYFKAPSWREIRYKSFASSNQAFITQ